MEGAVEVWLNELVTFMRDCLRGCLVIALEEASLWDTERPREEWVAFHCAQIALITSQIVWTEETETALDDLENGTDDAVKKYLDVSDSEQKMNLNLPSGRCRLHETTVTPSMRPHGSLRVSRERFRDGIVPHRSVKVGSTRSSSRSRATCRKN